jgi:hypothetical protein
MVSEEFKKSILTYIVSESEKDPLFKAKFDNPKKKIEDCCLYILNQVKKSGQNGFADAEIFGMAIHYYTEEKIDIGKPINANVVVNHHVDKPRKKVEIKKVDLFAQNNSNSEKEIKKSNRPEPTKEKVIIDKKTSQVSMF